MTLLHKTLGEDLKGLNAVVVGASNIVGRPMALELLLAGCTTTVTHRFSKPDDQKMLIKNADIVVVAVGKPKFLDGDLIKDGATVIDVGINRMPDGKLCGDVEDVYKRQLLLALRMLTRIIDQLLIHHFDISNTALLKIFLQNTTFKIERSWNIGKIQFKLVGKEVNFIQI